MMIEKLKREDSWEKPVKLGTVSTHIYIHKDDLPLEAGDHIRYSKRNGGKLMFGKVKRLAHGITPIISVDGNPEKVEGYEHDIMNGDIDD